MVLTSEARIYAEPPSLQQQPEMSVEARPSDNSESAETSAPVKTNKGRSTFVKGALVWLGFKSLGLAGYKVALVHGAHKPTAIGIAFAISSIGTAYFCAKALVYLRQKRRAKNALPSASTPPVPIR